MTLTIIVLSIAWLFTAAMFYVERRERLALYARAVQAETTVQAVRTVTNRILEQRQPEALDAQLRPMVETAERLDGFTGHQKRMRVILEFLKAHPGVSVAEVEEGIERVLIRGR